MNRKVNIAVIGTGRIGSMHVANIVRSIPEANLSAICDIRLDVAQAVADEFGIQRVVKDYHDLLADKDIEAYLISSSTNTHTFIMKDIAAAGKHIFCEKPLVDGSGIVLMMPWQPLKKPESNCRSGSTAALTRAFNRCTRWWSRARSAGPASCASPAATPNSPPWNSCKVSGGMFLDMSIHDFDMARFLIGDVEEIYATGGVLVAPELNEIGDIDTNIINLKFANGTLGTIDNSRQAVYGYDQRLEVFCSNGIAMADQ